MIGEVDATNQGCLCASKDESVRVVQDPFTFKSCFFARLEILGFKNSIMHKNPDQRKKIRDDVSKLCKEAIEYARVGASISEEDFKSGIGFRVDSGSIYVWTKNDEWLLQFDDLVHIVQDILAGGFERGFPSRGVIGYGALKFSKDELLVDVSSSLNDSLSCYGDTLDAVCDEGARIDWSGVVLTKNAMSKVAEEFKQGKEDAERGGARRIVRPSNVQDLDALFCRFPWFVRQEWLDAVAVNWNYDKRWGLTDAKIRKAFDGPCVAFAEDVETKFQNALEFFNRTQNVAKSRRASQNASSTVAEPDLLGSGEDAWPHEAASFRGGGISSASSRRGYESDTGDKSRELADFLTNKAKSNG